jgi:uncharacterized protein (TIGR03067 family)
MFRSAVSAEGARPLPTLDGWWLARSASLGGVRLTADVLPALTMLLFDRTLYLGNDIGRLDIDRGTDPPSLDILITRGPNRWRFIPGIFKQQGRRLQLCVDLSGVTRPADFMAPLGSRLLSVTNDCAPVDDGPSDCAPLFA